MKLWVRTTGERNLNSYAFLSYEKLIDYEHKPMESFIKQMRIISEYDSVLMEDDLEFCDDFLNKITDVINKYPDNVINFYQQPYQYFKTTELNGISFMYNQCTYYPKGISGKIADEMEKIYIETGCTKYDVVEAMAMYNLKINYICYRPLLVKHIGEKSFIGNKHDIKLASMYFIDNLENIDYNDDLVMKEYTQNYLKKLRKFNCPVIFNDIITIRRILYGD